jgi:putative peptidoglycan lipid II flippase
MTFKTTIDKAVRALVALTIPAAVVVGFGVRPFLGLAFHFDEEGIRLLNTVTQMYLLGLVAHSLIEVGARAFYSRQDARIPLFASGVALVTFVSLGAWLSTGGAGGLAVANSLAFTVEMLLLFFLLARKTGQQYTLRNTILRTIGAALTAAVILLVGQYLIPQASLLMSTALILVAIAAVIPFIWTELRLLLRL